MLKEIKLISDAKDIQLHIVKDNTNGIKETHIRYKSASTPNRTKDDFCVHVIAGMYSLESVDKNVVTIKSMKL